MLVEKSFKQWINQLVSGQNVHINFGGSAIAIRFVDNNSKIVMNASVFNGGNYIPQSVRRSISLRGIAPYTKIRSYLTIDEVNFQVILNYLGQTEHLKYDELGALVEEFGYIAEEWREYLEQHGKNDLIFVHTKR